MQKFLLTITLSLFVVAGIGTMPSSNSVVFAQKRDKDEKKKDPPGPPVVKDKGGNQEKPKDSPPKKDKRP